MLAEGSPRAHVSRMQVSAIGELQPFRGESKRDNTMRGIGHVTHSVGVRWEFSAPLSVRDVWTGGVFSSPSCETGDGRFRTVAGPITNSQHAHR